ncbi:D-alanyl-D-alanine carboxypeptidase [Streptomyces venezuelae]|uniref:D-alanyl-D-alanine carboxypeptidase n=1 Tax=Streptomyces venezuelae TaxID=54571 RepID=UPI00378A910C
MAYEEASVAGETPDRSKQRKSSGNPTPEETSGPAPEERDPRLAITRETPQVRDEIPADRATAVFSTKDAADAASGSDAPDDAPKGEPGGDARLRNAVAAWVATSDDDAEPGPGSGSESADSGAAKRETSDKSEAADTSEVSDSPDASDASETTGAADRAAGTTATGPAAEPASGTEAETGPDAASRSEAAPKSEPASGPKAAASSDPAAWPEPASGSEAEFRPATAPRPGSASRPEPVSGPTSGSKPEPVSRPEAASGSEAASKAEPGSKPEPGSKAEPGSKPAPGSKPEPASRPVPASRPEAASGSAPASRPDPASKPEPGSKPESGSKPAPGSKPAAVSWPEAASKADAEPESDPAPELDAAAEDDPAEADAADAKSTGVDQATAVFKAPKVPEAGGKGVDQPTTMLKLGDSAKGTAKKGTAKPEADAERTSKFVALKPLDEPKAKPGSAAGAKGGSEAGAKAAPEAEPKAPAPRTGTAPAGPAVPPPVEPTTQQPLPPKPPIDLLAELTNTPPPPETPVRTAVRRVKIWTPLVLLLLVVFAVVQVVRPLPTPTLQLTAQETVKFEGGKPDVPWPADGQAAMDVNGIGTFGTSGEQKPVPIASIAKVMTVYLILRDHPLKKGEDGPKIPVDAAAQKHYETGKPANESVVKVTEGQKITEYEALQAVMLPSANNIAKLLARWDTKSGSEDAFVEKMNKTAKELGMKNTHYTDPSGLDKTTVSTAEDLVKLGRAAMENPVFNEISRQPSYMDLNNEKQTNFFKLVPTVAIGIKTGTTTAAGGNILFAAEKTVGGKTQTIIGAALGQYGSNGVANIDKVTDVTKNLIAAGQDALKAKTIVKKGEVVGQVDDGLGGTTPVVATKDVSAVGWSGLTVKLELDDMKGKTVPNTAKAGTEVGVLHVGDGKGDAVEVPVALQKDLAEPGFGAKLTRVG